MKNIDSLFDSLLKKEKIKCMICGSNMKMSVVEEINGQLPICNKCWKSAEENRKKRSEKQKRKK